MSPMYADLARSVFLDEQTERVAEDLRVMRRRHPGLSRDELCGKLIGRAAARCAAVGALSSAPGGWPSPFPVATDLPYQVLALNRLARSVLAAFDRPTTGVERAMAAAGSLALAGASEWLRAGTVEVARRALRRRSPRLAPLLAAAIGGALSYAAVRAVGWLAEDYCRASRPRRSRRRK